jgi:hypothetical protein
VVVPAMSHGEGSQIVVSLYGRELVEDLEVQRAAGITVDHDIERIGLEFRIATRLTSWVAVSEEPAVDPTQPVRRERIPHALAHGLSLDGLGLVRRPGRAAGSALVTRAMLGGPPMIAAMPAATFMTARHEVETLGHGISASRAMLVGRVVLRKDRELIIEITLSRPLDWHPGDGDVSWPDGTCIHAEIVRERTTAQGRLARGLTVRLGLRLVADGPDGVPETVTLGGEHGLMVIRVRRA